MMVGKPQRKNKCVEVGIYIITLKVKFESRLKFLCKSTLVENYVLFLQLYNYEDGTLPLVSGDYQAVAISWLRDTN